MVLNPLPLSKWHTVGQGKCLKVLVLSTCVTAVLPYGIILLLATHGRMSLAYRSALAIFDIFASLWIALLVVTLIVGQWQRKLFWLLILLPVACATWLLTLYDALLR